MMRSILFALTLVCSATAQDPELIHYRDEARILRELVANSDTALSILDLSTESPLVRDLDEHLPVLSAWAAELEKADVNPAVGVRLHRDRFTIASSFDLRSSPVASSLWIVQQDWDALDELLADAGVPQADRDRLLKPAEAVVVAQIRASMARNRQILQRFEWKFGPASAQLNLVESLINYWLLRGLDPIGLDDDGMLGQWEVITSYSTAYLRRSLDRSDEFDVASALELGLRRYMFRRGWENSNPYKPGYMSAGAIVTGGPDGVLYSPFSGQQRWGAFVGWGSIKAAWIFDEEGDQLLLSKQFQVLPGVF